jgi:hypothetical protein
MLSVNEIFYKELDELGIPREEFPYDFLLGREVCWPIFFDAMIWVLKKRQDKMLEQLQAQQNR